MKNKKILNHIFTNLLPSLIFLILLSPTLGAADLLSPPYNIQWPSGWEITKLPLPLTNSGKNLGGERIRALRLENGSVAAVIELTYFPRSDQGKANLQEEFKVALQTVKENFEQQKMTVNLGSPKTSTLAGHPSIETDISVKGQDLAVKLWLGMTYTQGYLYSLSYTGQQTNFIRFLKVFHQTRESLRLK